ncbi:hypothetical protein HDU85_006432 [Gaertneriomyces sp. JEL0708]|nr:hypothetical protein HDU85_006432 [Gaertneriomyces sp. JEL0708]
MSDTDILVVFTQSSTIRIEDISDQALDVALEYGLVAKSAQKQHTQQLTPQSKRPAMTIVVMVKKYQKAKKTTCLPYHQWSSLTDARRNIYEKSHQSRRQQIAGK